MDGTNRYKEVLLEMLVFSKEYGDVRGTRCRCSLNKLGRN